MPTLRIEHEIVDFDTWKQAFDRFADLRTNAGVRRHHIQQPIDDPHYIMIDLEFNTTAEADAFADILRTKIWASPDNAPALAGTPQTRILETLTDESPITTVG